MLCPEVSKFSPPKVLSSTKRYENLDKVVETFAINNFYSSLIISVPDELKTPSCIEESVTEDNEYYKITNCSLVEFFEHTFIEKFVKNGRLYCLSAGRNCMVHNCAAITPNGILTIHLPSYIFQTVGLEGTKRPHNFYDIKIDLNTLIKRDEIIQSLKKIEIFDFWISWVPHQETICPSSIAKYFYDRSISVSVHTANVSKVIPDITEVPSSKDVEVYEMAEWIGMLAHGGDLAPTETYISTYEQPVTDFALKTTRMNLCIVKGFITSDLVNNICKKLEEYFASRETENYWVGLCVQSHNNSLWQWSPSSPQIFQAHDCSYNVFISQDGISVFTVGQLKYS